MRIWWLLLAPVFMADDPRLDHAREVNLKYAATLPNFVADETAKRYTASDKSPRWRSADTIETEVTIRGNRASREQIRRNGKPWTRSFDSLPGFKWAGGFGTEIEPLFDPQCQAALEYEGTAGKLLDYAFIAPRDTCFNTFFFGNARYNPPRTGHAFIDSATGNVMQYEEEASEFPSGYGFAYREYRVFWDYVKIGEDSHLLPVKADFIVHYTSGARWRIEAQFKNHRHFEASSNLTFH